MDDRSRYLSDYSAADNIDKTADGHTGTTTSSPSDGGDVDVDTTPSDNSGSDVDTTILTATPTPPP